MSLRAVRTLSRCAGAALAWVLALVALPTRAKEQNQRNCESSLWRVLCAERPDAVSMCECLRSQATGGDSPELLIALVPDPVETGATNVFDRTMEAANEGIVSSCYLRDRYWLPWTAPHVGGTESEVSCASDVPGVMTFRAREPADAKGFSNKRLVVLVVGESSVYGVHPQALRTALEWAQCAQPGSLEASSTPIRILGPYYSGSVDSLLRSLSQAGPRPLHLASGTVQSNLAQKRLRQLQAQRGPGGAKVKLFTASLQERRDHLEEFLGRAGKPVSMALLNEAGTQYGSPSKGTPQGDKKASPSLLYLNFPPHVAAGPAPAERKKHSGKHCEAEGAAASARDGSPKWERPLPVFAQQELPRDTIPALSGYDRVTSDLLLVTDANTLREEDAGEIVISATAPEDSLFLVRRLGQLLPNRRFALTSLDLIQLHPQLTAELEGTLVVTAYPALGDFRKQASAGNPAAPRRIQHTLSRDASVGTYHAVRWLLTPGEECGAGEAPQQNLTVGVIARERFWPLYPTHAEGPVQARVSFWFVSIALWLLTAWCVTLLGLFQLCARPNGDHGERVPPAWLKFWFRPFRMFQPCLDPVLERWHAFWITTTCAATLILSVAFACVWAGLEKGWLLSLPWSLAALASYTVPWLRMTDWLQWLELKDARDKRYVWALNPVLFCILGYAIAFFTAAGILASQEPMRTALLRRTSQLAGGASPLFVLIIVAACLALFAYSHAVRLRALDVPVSLSDRSGILWRAAPECRPEEKQLLECASTPGGVWYWSAFAAALGLCAYILLLARPLAVVFESGRAPGERVGALKAWVANNTVEDFWLALAIMVGLFAVHAIIILRLLKYCRYVRGLSRLLRAVAASPCMAMLDRVEAPLRLSVTEQLSRGEHERAELLALWRPLEEAGIAAKPSLLNPDPSREQHPLFVARVGFKALVAQIQAMRKGLELRTMSEPRRLKAEAAIATYVAFVLGRYIRQVRYFMMGLMQPLAALFACTMFYPFAARRALFAIFLVLTLSALIVALITLLRLERDPVLLRIKGSTSTSSAVTAGLGRVLLWGAIPIGVALSSYFPSLAQRVMQVVQLLGLSQ